MPRSPVARILLLWIQLSCWASALLGAQERQFDVSASIALNTFFMKLNSSHEDGILVSPDGAYAVFVTSQGRLQSNTVQSSLWLVPMRAIAAALERGTSDKETALHPRLLAQVEATPLSKDYDSRTSVITEVRWATDSSAVYFLGEDVAASHKLYIASLTGHGKTLLSGVEDVREYDLASGAVIYASPKAETAASPTTHEPEPFRAEGKSLADLLFPNSSVAFSQGLVTYRLHIIRNLNRGAQSLVPEIGRQLPDKPHDTDIFALSPDAHWLVRQMPLQEANKDWSAYEPVEGMESWRIRPSDADTTSPSNRWRLRSFVITDLSSGVTSRLIDSPIGDSLANTDVIGASWSDDGRRILLSNTTLPLAPASLDPEGRRVCTVAAVDIPTHITTCIVHSRDASAAVASARNLARYRLESMQFGTSADDVILSFWSRRGPWQETYHFAAHRWTLVSSLAPALRVVDTQRPYRLEVRSDRSHPSSLWGINQLTHREVPLWDPNPAWANHHFGEATAYEWTDPSGHGWRGVLLKPEHYDPTRRYPLIIQTHGVDDTKFLLDGKYSTAENAQALSSAGFVVMQIPYRTDHVDTSQEASDQLVGYRSLISNLAEKRLIDPTRVGVVGFSRTGFHVEEALIQAPDLFAAAVIADGSDISYMTYRLYSRGDTFVAQGIEKIIGQKPLGPDGMQTWMQHASGFRLSTVKTPLLIQAIGPMSLLMEWELYSTVKELNVPSDLLYIPGGQHVLQTPCDKYESQQGTLDWFVRWLMPSNVDKPNPHYVQAR